MFTTDKIYLFIKNIILWKLFVQRHHWINGLEVMERRITWFERSVTSSNNLTLMVHHRSHIVK